MMNRRQVLQGAVAAGATASAAGLLGCSDDWSPPSPVQARTTGTLEAVAGWLAIAPREGLFERVIDRIEEGLTVDELYDAGFLASLRTFPQSTLDHAGLAYGAARSLAGSDPIARIKLFFHLIDQEHAARRWIAENWDVRVTSDPEPESGDAARQRFIEGLLVNHAGRAEAAAVAILRDSGPQPLIDLFWRHGIRDFNGVGHRQIGIAQLLDAAGDMGWEHGEAAVRALVRRLVERDPADADPRELRDYPLNVARAAPAGWLDAERSDEHALAWLTELRELSSEDAGDALVGHLSDRSPDALWDGIVMHAMEALLSGGSEHTGFNLHRLTTIHALRSGYLGANDPNLQFLILLQATSFVRWFPSLRADGAEEILFDSLEADDTPLTNAADVFAELGTADPNSADERLSPGTAPDQDLQLGAAQRLMALFDEQPEARAEYMAASLDILYRKPSGVHQFKFMFALFEEASLVGPTLQNRLLASSVFGASGAESADWPALAEAEAALSRLA